MKAPAGWTSTVLHRIAEVRSGLSKSAKREGRTIKKPYLRVANVQDGFLDLSEIKEIDVPENQVERFMLKPGDLLLIEGNGNPENLGRGCIWEGQIPDCVHQNHVFAVRVLPDADLLPKFLALQLQSDHGRDYLLSCAKGSTGLSTLNSAQLKEFPLLAPSVTEQLSITDMAGCWSRAIEKTEQLIAAKENRFLALIDRLVLQPASARVWKTQKLRDIATRVQRRSDGGDHPVLTISNVSGFVLQEEKYERYMAGESVKDYILLRRGEFAYNKGNSLRFQFGCIYQLSTYDEALVPHVYVCFHLHDDICSSYLRHLFAVDYLKPQLGKLVKTGVRNNGLLNIRPDEFLGVTVPIPPIEQQHRIAEILNAARTEIDLLKRQADTYRTQKRGLMQKLLTGQWRVNV